MQPNILFDDRYKFTLGGVKFEIFHTPGETTDQLTVWIPKYRAAPRAAMGARLHQLAPRSLLL